MTKKEFLKKLDDFSSEISSDSDQLEDVKHFQDLCEIATFIFETKQRIESLKELLK